MRYKNYIKQINFLILIILVVDYNCVLVLVAFGVVFYIWSSYISQEIKKLAKIAKIFFGSFVDSVIIVV